MSHLHAIMVTYRRSAQLRDYFVALKAQTRPLDSLVVIDNDVDRSAGWIIDTHGLTHTDVSYIAAGDNIGPAGGIAEGMAAVLERAEDDDWVFTFDDDDPPQRQDLLAELERFGHELVAAGHPVGGVGLVGGRFDEQRGRFVNVPDTELHGAVAVSSIGGNQFPCYRVKAVRHAGVFDPRLFFGFEELDYGLRMRDHGYALYAQGDLWHEERTSAGRLNRRSGPDRGLGEPNWRRYYSNRNLVFLLRQRGLHRQAAFSAAIHVAKPCWNLLRSPRLAAHHLKLNVRAIYDAYRGQMGRTLLPTPKPDVPRT